MGGMQSKDNSNASDLEILELDTSENNSTLRRCSTFTDLYYHVSAAKARLIRNGNRPKILKRCTCQNYDPVYVLWKNSFENADLRAPRKIPPIKGKNRHVYDITGVLAGQQTPKGFPLYTTVYKSFTSFDEDFSDYEYVTSTQFTMSLLPYEEGSSQELFLHASSTLSAPETAAYRNHEEVPYEEGSSQVPLLDTSSTLSAPETAAYRNHEEVPYEEGSSQKLLLHASSTLSAPETAANRYHEEVPYEEGSSQVPLLDTPSTSSVPYTVINKDQQTVHDNINTVVQKEMCMKDPSKVIHEDKSHGIQASFVCKKPAEQSTIIQNQKQQNVATAGNKEEQPKRLICKNHRRKTFNWEYTVQQRRFIDIHDLGGCYYIF